MVTDPTQTFDAGNEFAGDPMAQLTQEPAAPAPEADPAVEAPEQADWSDQPPVDQDAQGAPETKTQAAPATLEIKGNKGVQKFDLTPDNEQLKRTLQYGMVAPKWKRERDEARAELAKVKPQVAQANEKAQVWDKLTALTQRGHYEQAVRAVLGDDGFSKFVAQMTGEAAEYDAADPTRRMEIERSRDQRAAAFKDYQAEEKLREREAKLEALESRVESERLRSLGTSELQSHDFRGYIEDADLANAMNQKLWKLAWTELEDVADAGGEITPEHVKKAFASNARVLRAGMQRQVKERVAKVIETKTKDATKQAQIAATERYPKSNEYSGWDGKSAKDLLKRMVRGS